MTLVWTSGQLTIEESGRIIAEGLTLTEACELATEHGHGVRVSTQQA